MQPATGDLLCSVFIFLSYIFTSISNGFDAFKRAAGANGSNIVELLPCRKKARVVCLITTTRRNWLPCTQVQIMRRLISIPLLVFLWVTAEAQMHDVSLQLKWWNQFQFA